MTPPSGRSGKLISPLGVRVAQYKILRVRKRWVEILLSVHGTVIRLREVQLGKGSQAFYSMHSSLLFGQASPPANASHLGTTRGGTGQ